jgi:hypothetical protein
LMCLIALGNLPMLKRVFRIAKLRVCPWFVTRLWEPRPRGDGGGLRVPDRGEGAAPTKYLSHRTPQLSP